jgi:hypothetical protein
MSDINRGKLSGAYSDPVCLTDEDGFAVGGVNPIRVMAGKGDLITDAWGVQKISIAKSIFHGMWTFDISPKMWFMYENGVQVYTSTNIVSANGAAVITGSVASPDSILESRECPRYQPNRGHLFSTAVFCPVKLARGWREWGLQTVENGVFFRLKEDGLLYAVLKSGGVEVKDVAIDTSTVPNFDVEMGNIYDIQFQWRGVGDYFFYINNTLVHTIANLGMLTALGMENPALPVAYHCHRDLDDVVIKVGCADITSENGVTDTEQYSSAYVEAITAATDTPIFTLHNPLAVGGVTNTRTVTLARISFNASKKSVFKVWLTRDATAFTGMTLQTLGDGSFVQTDSVAMNPAAVKATAVNTALLSPVTAVPVEAAVPRLVDNPYRGRIEFPIVRGDYLAVTCTGAASSCDVVVEWGEQI